MPFCGTNPCGPRSQKKFIHEYEVGSTYTAYHFTKGKITFTVKKIVPVSTSTLTGEIIKEPGLLVNINGVSEIIKPRYLSNVIKKSDGGGLKPRKGRKGKKGKKGKKNRNNKTKRKSRRKTKKKSTKKKQRTKRRN